ncbi:Glu-tRNA(Gln) amidotransferase subunit GatD [Candidatus Woesearchaeota archaeon]|nr:Glu-tRNA(Gln) amidotransferase subunit GatD [Candidatus Woesearchaeota archaeon]
MKKVEFGDIVKVITTDKTYKGAYIDSYNKEIIILKQDSGYNLGIIKKGIKSIELIQKNKLKKNQKKNHKKSSLLAYKKDLPFISILKVGGTIVSKVDYKTGAVSAKISAEELLQNIPELKDIANISYKDIASVMSESMRFGHYNLIAKSIESELKKNKNIKGIIIPHGTDTMHYTGAALSFMLENIPVPVILVGSQRSSDRGSSDSFINIICAACFIAKSDFKGVAICMHENMSDNSCLILPGTKTKKIHTSRRDAFKPINTIAIARVIYSENKIEFLTEDYNSDYNEKKTFNVKYFKDNLKVGILKSHTNIYPENISCFKGYKGLILEGTGLGHFQSTAFDNISRINEKNKNEIKKLIKKGCIVILTSQCLYGRVNMNIYSPQRELLDIGVIPGKDMTTETAFIKLAFLLSNYSREQAKSLFLENLRSEINERILPHEFVDY